MTRERLRRVDPYGKSQRGDRLFLARVRVAPSQEIFAERSGMKRTAYRGCEAGLNKMTTQRILSSIARGFGVDDSTLSTYLDGEMSLPEFLQAVGGGGRGAIEQALGRLAMQAPEHSERYARASLRLVAHGLPSGLTVQHAVDLIRAQDLGAAQIGQGASLLDR